MKIQITGDMSVLFQLHMIMVLLGRLDENGDALVFGVGKRTDEPETIDEVKP